MNKLLLEFDFLVCRQRKRKISLELLYKMDYIFKLSIVFVFENLFFQFMLDVKKKNGMGSWWKKKKKFMKKDRRQWEQYTCRERAKFNSSNYKCDRLEAPARHLHYRK